MWATKRGLNTLALRSIVLTIWSLLRLDGLRSRVASILVHSMLSLLSLDRLMSRVAEILLSWLGLEGLMSLEAGILADFMLIHARGAGDRVLLVASIGRNILPTSRIEVVERTKDSCSHICMRLCLHFGVDICLDVGTSICVDTCSSAGLVRMSIDTG